MSFMDIQNVVFTYPGRPPVVDGIDWQIEAGEIHCLVGRSGCGKTTLLKLAAGLLRPQSGRILLRDGELVSPGPQIGFMFQAPVLLEWHRVIDNVLLPVSLQRRPDARDRARALALLDTLGLAAHAQHHPRALSGGQQSRVALARALILDPALLLLDEPFAALDAITRSDLQDDLLAMCRQRGTTVLFVTHDIAEAVYLGDRIAVMHGGRIVDALQVGLPTPRTQTLRHGVPFNQYCARVHAAMDQARHAGAQTTTVGAA
ncbi:ABC transporter ATP-binding protein [Pigmentiphaga aceris]|uniref:ABC transporter ATP-binding protein n=1 Tax=Pigmentiphaga aceris TaxID=1940612 RepID=A0A5C0AW33_9BURK|nr:ABC transporter ATP-binding protein [Pigmentiphaga aceris]QEI05834.1 ABC transporter ATP-binding protein [Pigmentiphaga aceris]